MCGRRKVFQNFTPTAVFFCRAAMTLVNDNQIEEVFIKKFAVPCKHFFVAFVIIFFFVACELLIQRKINLIRCYCRAVVLKKIDFMYYFFQRFEIAADCLVDKIVSIGKIKDFLFRARLQKTIYNLKSGICFTCAGSHNEQQTIFAFCDCIQRTIYGVSLVISWRICRLTCIERLIDKG